MYDGKKYPVVKGENVEKKGGERKWMSRCFQVLYLAYGEGEEEDRKGENEGEGEERTRGKNRMRRREISDRHRKKGSLFLSMISTIRKIGTEKPRSRRSALFDRACFAARGEKRKTRRKRSEKKG